MSLNLLKSRDKNKAFYFSLELFILLRWWPLTHAVHREIKLALLAWDCGKVRCQGPLSHGREYGLASLDWYGGSKKLLLCWATVLKLEGLQTVSGVDSAPCRPHQQHLPTL